MTALQQYQRLESPGLWRSAPEAQRREVIVAFGDATLVISDHRSARALAHWSLPALIRLNPGATPALFTPGAEAAEELELDDAAMIAAIDTVQAALVRRRPRPGRLRGRIGLALAVLAAGLGVFWLPGALISRAAAVAPPAKRAEIGRAVLDDLAKLTGAPCTGPGSAAVLQKLAAGLLGGGEIVLAPHAPAGALRLPGRIVVLGMPLVQGYDTPEVAAGHILAAHLGADLQDPLRALLGWAGIGAAFRLVTTGALPAETLAGYGEQLLRSPPPPPGAAVLLASFARAGIAAAPYAGSHDPPLADAAALIKGDPFRGDAPRTPLLTDGEWVTLQGACQQ